jgi:hypothetical protein
MARRLPRVGAAALDEARFLRATVTTENSPTAVAAVGPTEPVRLRRRLAGSHLTRP